VKKVMSPCQSQSVKNRVDKIKEYTVGVEDAPLNKGSSSIL